MWDPAWPECTNGYGEELWREDEALPFELMADELLSLVGPVRMWWTAEKRRRQRKVQCILNKEMTPLGRHLTFDWAARMARSVKNPHQHLRPLLHYPSPPY